MAYRSSGENLGSAPNLSQTSNPMILGYAGYTYNAESGFYHTMHRQMDPRTGRWLTKDPINFQGGDLNLYRYVMNNPVNLVDPIGLAALPPGAGASTNNSDLGVQMLVNSYLQQYGGNVNTAWNAILLDRKANIATGQASALAEHYLLALNEVLQGGNSAALQYLILIPGYTSVKAIEQSLGVSIFIPGDASLASFREIEWGYKGVSDALTCH